LILVYAWRQGTAFIWSSRIRGSRPTFLAWLPDSTLFVADGYNGTRVAKFDKDGKFLLDWGMKGTPPDMRPGYLNASGRQSVRG